MQVVPLFIDAIHIIPHTTVRQILVSAAWHVGCVFFSFAFFTGLLTGQPAQTQPSGMSPAGPNPICPWQLRMAWANLAPRKTGTIQSRSAIGTFRCSFRGGPYGDPERKKGMLGQLRASGFSPHPPRGAMKSSLVHFCRIPLRLQLPHSSCEREHREM